MSKKGQSISINTIIIAAIALAVLVVLFVIFTGRIGIFSQGVSKTASCENSCTALAMKYQDEAKSGCQNEGGTVIEGTYSDASIGCCCKKI